MDIRVVLTQLIKKLSYRGRHAFNLSKKVIKIYNFVTTRELLFRCIQVMLKLLGDYLKECGFYNFGNTCYMAAAINVLKRQNWFKQVTQTKLVSLTAKLLKDLMEYNLKHSQASKIYVSHKHR